MLLLAIVALGACGRKAGKQDAAPSSASADANRTVKIAWDAPAVLPKGYRILVDGRALPDIPVPPVDPSCKCLKTTVPVPPGQHTVKVIAYNEFGESAPSAVVVVK